MLTIDIDAIDSKGFIEIDSLKYILKSIVEELDVLKAIKNVTKMKSFLPNDLVTEVVGTDVYLKLTLDEEPSSFCFAVLTSMDKRTELVVPTNMTVTGKEIKFRCYDLSIESILVVYKNL